MSVSECDLVFLRVLGDLVEMRGEVAESVIVCSGEVEHQAPQSRHLITLPLTLPHHHQELLVSVT